MELQYVKGSVVRHPDSGQLEVTLNLRQIE
jgi:hypothetical protein